MTVDFALDNDPAGYVTAGLFALAFLALAGAVEAGRRWPAIGLAVLFAIEIAFAPFYARETVADWAIQFGFVLVSAVGLLAAIALLGGGRRRVSAQSERSSG